LLDTFPRAPHWAGKLPGAGASDTRRQLFCFSLWIFCTFVSFYFVLFWFSFVCLFFCVSWLWRRPPPQVAAIAVNRRKLLPRGRVNYPVGRPRPADRLACGCSRRRTAASSATPARLRASTWTLGRRGQRGSSSASSVTDTALGPSRATRSLLRTMRGRQPDKTGNPRGFGGPLPTAHADAVTRVRFPDFLRPGGKTTAPPPGGKVSSGARGAPLGSARTAQK